MLIKKHLYLLGYEVKDKVTGFTGVAESISFDLYGCIQAAIRPPMDKDGKIPDGRWFDVSRLVVKSKKPVMDVPNFEWGRQAEGEQGPAEKPCKPDPIA
jgi:hypothetical protein